MTKAEKIGELTQKMKDCGMDLYYLNTSDYHMSEYVPEYFRTIKYFSGFTGSLATMLIEKSGSKIFVDGRYHTQADRECLQNGVEVVKLGTNGSLDPISYIKKNYHGKTIGFDGKRTSISFGKDLIKAGFKVKSLDIYSNLIDQRQPLSTSRIYELEEKYTGLSRKKKMELITYCLDDKVHIINNLESIAYILNLRGNDIVYTPVFRAYMVIMNKEVYLFVDIDRIPDNVLVRLYEDGVVIRSYDSYYEFLKRIDRKKILLDENKVNYETYLCLKGRANHFYNMRSIVEQMKAIKNPVEQNNIRLAHIYDAIAVLRFLMWLDSVDKSRISEYDAAMKLDECRLNFKADDLSFNSIVAYNENAAMMHYAPTQENSSMLDNSGILLFDSGGQYKFGTTDVTRTIALGPVSNEIKMYFTLVLKSMFNLSELKFLEGLSGNQIDVLARMDLWRLGVDYRCGTGHGVGYNLSVHESPPNIRYSSTGNSSELTPLKAGMVFSDEPGVYFENKFGIRCENMLLCLNSEKNEYGQFLEFETLTLIPFDKNLIDKNYLDKKTITIINRYHKRIYDALSPYLNMEELEYLRKLTSEI